MNVFSIHNRFGIISVLVKDVNPIRQTHWVYAMNQNIDKQLSWAINADFRPTFGQTKNFVLIS